VHTGFWWGDLMEGDHVVELAVGGRIRLKWIIIKGNGAWTVLF
jgi:hypothetical protein